MRKQGRQGRKKRGWTGVSDNVGRKAMWRVEAEAHFQGADPAPVAFPQLRLRGFTMQGLTRAFPIPRPQHRAPRPVKLCSSHPTSPWAPGRPGDQVELSSKAHVGTSTRWLLPAPWVFPSPQPILLSGLFRHSEDGSNLLP